MPGTQKKNSQASCVCVTVKDTKVAMAPSTLSGVMGTNKEEKDSDPPAVIFDDISSIATDVSALNPLPSLDDLGIESLSDNGLSSPAGGWLGLLPAKIPTSTEIATAKGNHEASSHPTPATQTSIGGDVNQNEKVQQIWGKIPIVSDPMHRRGR